MNHIVSAYAVIQIFGEIHFLIFAKVSGTKDKVQ